MNTDLNEGFDIHFYGTKELGETIRAVRKQRHMTQADLARCTGTSKKFISDVENGKEHVWLSKVLLLIRMLDMGTKVFDLRKSDG